MKHLLIIFLVLISLSFISAQTATIDNSKISADKLTIEIKGDSNVQWQQVDNSYTPIYKDTNKYTAGKLKPITNITFRVNKLNDKTCSGGFYIKICNESSWDFSTFESKNTITSKQIMAVYSDEKTTWIINVWENILKLFGKDAEKAQLVGYDITYFGNIKDLDPSLVYSYTTTTEIAYLNYTTVSSQGLSLTRNATAYNVTSGTYTTFVFYNQTATYWNLTLAITAKNMTNGTVTSLGKTINSQFRVSNNYNLSDNNLVSQWSFNNDSAQYVQDDVGKNNGLFVYGNTPIQSGYNLTTGKNGTTGTISLNFSTTDVTFAFWAKPNSVNTGDAYLGGIMDGAQTYFFQAGGGAHPWSFYCQSASTAFATAGKWDFIVGYYNSTSKTQTLYVNNINYGTGGTCAFGNVTKLILGYGNQRADGVMDELVIWKRILTPQEMGDLWNQGSGLYVIPTMKFSSGTYINQSLYGVWHFDENTSTNVGDSFGNNNFTMTASSWAVGNISANNSATEDNGTIGKGYGLNGNNQWINASSLSMNLSRASFSLWFKDARNAQTGYLIVQRQTPAGADGFLLYQSSAHLALWYNTVQLLVNPMTQNTWHNAVGTYDGTNLTFYIDGAVVGTTNVSTLGITTRPLAIGASINGANPWNGSIDEVRLYNRTLSASEVLDLYQMGSSYLNWTNWSNSQAMTDGSTRTTSQQGKFAQFKFIFATNDSAFSPYVMNHTVTSNPTAGASDVIPPTINITYPLNITYPALITNMSYTSADESGIDKCWYSLNGGVTNSSYSAANATVTGLASSEGSNTWSVYCNDTLGNLGLNTTTFYINLPPVINVNSPTEGSINNLVFNYSQTCTDVQGIFNQWYNWKGIIYSYNSSLDLYSSAGSQSIIAYCNDTFGNVNSTTRSFTTVAHAVNQTCPTANSTGSWSQIGSYPNGTIQCTYTPFSVGPQGPPGSDGGVGPQGPAGPPGANGTGTTTVRYCPENVFGYFNPKLASIKINGCMQ